MSRTLLPLTLGLATLVGCGPPPNDDGQSGEENVGCLPVETAEYALADETPLGFTGQQVVDLVSGSHPTTLTWASGTGTDLALDVTVDATTVTWSDNEMQDDGSGMESAEMALDCPDTLSLDVTLGFATADGAFAESWDLSFAAATADLASVWHELDLDGLAGSYAVTEVDPADYDRVRAFLDLTIEEAGPWGVLDGQAEDDGDSSDPDGVASATHFDIATIGAPAE